MTAQTGIAPGTLIGGPACGRDITVWPATLKDGCEVLVGDLMPVRYRWTGTFDAKGRYRFMPEGFKVS